MRAKELRAQARYALRGRWGVAVAVSLVAGLLGGGFGGGSGSSVSAEGQLSFVSHNVWMIAVTLAVVGLLLAVIIGGSIQLGLCDFNIRLVKKQEVRFGMLFGHFHRLWDGIRMNLVVSFFTLLWMLLFVIPGIIAVYRYAMVPYLMAEFPDLGVMDAMAESKRLMKGNKWRLFCLELSYIGWALLSILTLGIGNLWLTPYIHAGTAAFYMDVTGRGLARQTYDTIDRAPEF